MVTKKDKIKKEKVSEKKAPSKKKEVVKEKDILQEENKNLPENETSKEKPVKEDKSKGLKKGFISGTGRRKTSVARVFLWQEKGEFIVNGFGIDTYFSADTDKLKWERPFHMIGVSHPEAKFSASIKTSGSGKPSQLDAVVLGISRALSKIDIEFDKILRKQGLLTRDSRMVERKKPFLHKARKRPQYSKR